MTSLEIKTRVGGVDPEILQEALHVSAPMARILSARGIHDESEIDYRVSQLDQPDSIPDIERAANRIVDAIEKHERIFVCGDYDADGATASSLFILFFREIAYDAADFRVPNRFSFGYGLTTRFVETLIPDNPDLLITVDNGVSSTEGIELAGSHDIDVIVTDHHLAPTEQDRLPPAHSIVNPNLPNSAFESEPCGVGVAFYLLAAVRRELAERGYFEEHAIEAPDMRQWLDLVAVGTVVDMVPLDLNNRRLVSEGLRRMRNGQMRPGFRAICEVSRTPIETLTTRELGFRIGPRINAAGRLDDISVGIRLLVAEDPDEALELAMMLQEMNIRRRAIQTDMNETANQLVNLVGTDETKSCCVYHRDFHEGVVGLVASRLVDRTGAPAIVFADAEDSDAQKLKGSARSIDGVHIRDVLAFVDARFPKLMLQFGGHAGAAGLTIYKQQFERFSNVFDDAVRTLAAEDAFNPTIYTDGELNGDEVNLALVDEIDGLEPWGQAFTPPTFHGTFDVVSTTRVGRNREHQKFILRNGSRHFEAIAFSHPVVEADQITMVYQLNRNTYAGEITLQLIASKIEVVD
ncbi:MAG: single-stranded-DNA-specific exonuclease RecJ [Gammaproteobacteria bacterium]|nr:single-stranded-DNA-specific exonuclease RecJ [Gammaproteobacteria bacterium]